MKLLFIFLSLVGCILSADARLVLLESHQELKEKADVVAILKATKSEKVVDPDVVAQKLCWRNAYQSWVTTFSVLTEFKGSVSRGGEIKVLHYSLKPQNLGGMNSPSFVKFVDPNRYVTIQTLSNEGQVIESRAAGKYAPDWFAFLKKRADGMYEPASGQLDAEHSFKPLFLGKEVKILDLKK